MKSEFNQNFKREFSAGCVVFRKLNTKYKILNTKYLLGKHSGYHKWVLPKGLIEKGERGFEAAVRETEEELGVRVKLLSDKPIHKETYIYHADIKTNQHPKNGYQSSRRVIKYQEEGGHKIKIFKTVTFYLAEYMSGNPEDHGWEMEDAGWYTFQEALKLMSFKGEKEALKKGNKILQDL